MIDREEMIRTILEAEDGPALKMAYGFLQGVREDTEERRRSGEYREPELDQRLMEKYEKSPVVATVRKLVKQGSGHWEGSASDIVKASRYLGCQVNDDVRVVGKLISDFEGLFWAVDGLAIDGDRTGKKRSYIFDVINVTNDTNVINDTDVTQLRFET